MGKDISPQNLGVALFIQSQIVREAVTRTIAQFDNIQTIDVPHETAFLKSIRQFLNNEPDEQGTKEKAAEKKRQKRKMKAGGSVGGLRHVLVIASMTTELIDVTMPRWFAEFDDSVSVVGVRVDPPPESVWSFEQVISIRPVGDLRQGIATAISHALTRN